jgi:hypothetical protein
LEKKSYQGIIFFMPFFFLLVDSLALFLLSSVFGVSALWSLAGWAASEAAVPLVPLEASVVPVAGGFVVAESPAGGAPEAFGSESVVTG